MTTDREQSWQAQIRTAGLVVTAQRLAILRVLSGEGRHLDADELGALARAEIGTLSQQAVYDNLRALSEVGLVRRIEPAGIRAALYETRTGDNHHHMVCRACGTTLDVDCVREPAPCLEPSETHDFLIDAAEVTFWGICPACRSAPRVVGGASR